MWNKQLRVGCRNQGIYVIHYFNFVCMIDFSKILRGSSPERELGGICRDLRVLYHTGKGFHSPEQLKNEPSLVLCKNILGKASILCLLNNLRNRLNKKYALFK